MQFQFTKARILADLLRSLSGRFSRKSLLVAIGGTTMMSVVLATTAPFASTGTLSQQLIDEAVLLPQPVFTQDQTAMPFVREENIRSGDSIHALMRRLGASDPVATDFLLNDKEAQQALRQLRAGRSVRAQVMPDGKLRRLELPIAQRNEYFTLSLDAQGNFVGKVAAPATETVLEMRGGVITHSLFGATDAAGLPDSIAMKLAELFGTEIDFHTDLRRGDRFAVLYESIYENGQRIDTGRILAAEFENNGKLHRIALFKTEEGQEEFFSADGRSLRQGFLRSPLEFSRVTSGFGRRLHPIYQNWRAHNGVDFGAPTGTPVKAASDGTVDFVGSQNGYGNIVVLRHRGRYSTAYAHLNGFAKGLTKGQRINQGDVIGFVGATGWATGPHLHYEVRIDNVPHDPMNVALPMVEPLTGQALARFKRQSGDHFERLALLDNTQQLSMQTR